MRAEREPDLATFTRRTGGLLARDPVLHTVICVVVEAGVRRPELFPGAAWITVSDGDEVVGAAMRTPPYPVALTPMPDPALDALADLVATEPPDAPGVTGPRPYADRLATRWQDRTGGTVREVRAMRLFRLHPARAARPRLRQQLRGSGDAAGAGHRAHTGAVHRPGQPDLEQDLPADGLPGGR
jgi:hypothetical protein